jgi:hypothetical protein
MAQTNNELISVAAAVQHMRHPGRGNALFVKPYNTHQERSLYNEFIADNDVCKFFLSGLSPYSLFRNSRAATYLENYGNSYTKEEDDDCKQEYDVLPQEIKDKYGYEYELYQFLDQLVRKCDQKVQKNKQRLDEEMISKSGEVTEEDIARLIELNDKIKALTEKAEALGEEVSFHART